MPGFGPRQLAKEKTPAAAPAQEKSCYR